MKKILLSFITIFILSFSCSYATFTQENMRFISETTAKELWGTEMKLNERTGIIEIKHNEKLIFGTMCQFI